MFISLIIYFRLNATDNGPYHKSMATMANFHELHFQLLRHSPYSPDLALSEYHLLAELKRMLQGKRFGFNEEVIAETEAYFEAKDKSFYKKIFVMLEKNELSLLKKTILMNKLEFCLKGVL